MRDHLPWGGLPAEPQVCPGEMSRECPITFGGIEQQVIRGQVNKVISAPTISPWGPAAARVLLGPGGGGLSMKHRKVSCLSTGLANPVKVTVNRY